MYSFGYTAGRRQAPVARKRDWINDTLTASVALWQQGVSLLRFKLSIHRSIWSGIVTWPVNIALFFIPFFHWLGPTFPSNRGTPTSRPLLPPGCQRPLISNCFSFLHWPATTVVWATFAETPGGLHFCARLRHGQHPLNINKRLRLRFIPGHWSSLIWIWVVVELSLVIHQLSNSPSHLSVSLTPLHSCLRNGRVILEVLDNWGMQICRWCLPHFFFQASPRTCPPSRRLESVLFRLRKTMLFAMLFWQLCRRKVSEGNYKELILFFLFLFFFFVFFCQMLVTVRRRLRSLPDAQRTTRHHSAHNFGVKWKLNGDEE